MANCITCGAELHPERARKYDYCMSRECQEKNAKGLTMVALGMNKAADELMILDERTREDLATGKYRDQRRGSFGTSVPATGPETPPARPAARPEPAPARPEPAPARPQPAPARAEPAPARPAARPARRAQPKPAGRAPVRPRQPWTERQERLALIYNEQGLRPDEIAPKLGVSTYLATQIVLAARNRRQP